MRSALAPRAASLALLLAASACGNAEHGAVAGTTGTGGGGAGGPRFPGCDASAKTQTMTFVHMNDMHGHYGVEPGSGGSLAARIRGYFESAQMANPYTLFTNGGDDYEKGSVAEVLSNYVSTREVSRALDFDVRVIGNHDFSWSEDELLDYSGGDNALVLSSNVTYTGPKTGAFKAVPYGEMTIGCLKIGFIGAVSAPWNDENQQYQGNYYPDFLTDLDFVDVHRKLIAAHRQDVDLLIAVSHLGLGDDMTVGEMAPGLDIILGGHSHTPMFSPEMAGSTLVIQAGSYSAYVAQLDIDVDLTSRKIASFKYSLNTVDANIDVSPTAEAAIEKIMATYGPNVYDAIGQSNANYAQGPQESALVCKGAIDVLGVDAAAIDAQVTYDAWASGPVSQQSIFDVFRIERQPPGTPSWTATYTADIDGASLAMFSQLPAATWAMIMPSTIDPTKTYKIALPRYAALHPADYLPKGVTLANAAFASETWQVVESLAIAQQKKCFYIESDTAIPGCTP